MAHTMPGILDNYRQYLASTGQTDDRPDRDIIAEIGGTLEEKRPDLLQADPDFHTQYQEIKRSNYPSLSTEFGRAVKSGTEGLISTGLGGAALVTGSDYLKGKAKEWDDAAGANAPTIPTLEDIAPERKGIRRALSEDALRYGLSKVGSVAPSIAESVLTAGVGAAAGTALGPEGTLAGAAGGFFEKNLVKAAMKKLLAKGEEATAANIAKEAAAIGAFRGGVAANAASSFVLNAGDVASEGADTGTTLALGIVAALPDTILPAYVLSKLFPGVAKKEAAELGKTWLARHGTKLAELVGVPAEEFGQEYFQQAADVVARNVKDGKDPLTFSEDNLKELREAGIAGAAGGLLAAPGVILSGHGAEKPSIRQKMADAALNGEAPPAPPAAPLALVLPVAPSPAVVSPARRVATMSPEEQQARYAQLSEQGDLSPDEQQELDLLQAIGGAAPAPLSTEVPPQPAGLGQQQVSLPITEAPPQPSTPTTDALQIPSTSALDVRNLSGNGEAVGGGNAVVQEAAPPVSEEKRAQVKEAVATPGVTYQFSVFEPVGGKPPTVQVDIVAPDKSDSLASTSPELLRELGVPVPPIPATLPMGRYSLEQIQQAAAAPTAAPEQDLQFATAAPQSYSRLIRAVETSTQGKANGAQWKAAIKNSKSGINQDEFALTRVEDLEDGKPYTKQEVLDYLRANEVTVNDVTLGEPLGTDDFSTMSRDELAKWYEDKVGYDPVKDDPSVTTEQLRQNVRSYAQEEGAQTAGGGAPFSEYQLPGGKEGSYREVLLTAPGRLKWEDGHSQYSPQKAPLKFSEGDLVDLTKPERLRKQAEDVFGPEIAPQLNLTPVQRAMVPLVHNDKVRRAIISAIPINVVNLLSEEGISAENLHGNLAMLGNHLSPKDAKLVASAIGAGLEKSGALAGARIYQSLSTGVDNEILPALRASELDTNSLLQSLSQFRRSDLGPGMRGMVARSTNTATKTGFSSGNENFPTVGTRTPGLGDPPMQTGAAAEAAPSADKLTMAELADLGNGHAEMQSGSGSGVKNPIVRLRYNERTTADGKRILFLEEVQAPQKGQFEKMPALFQKNWREIAFKWALKKASDEGYDAIGWTTGEQQAARYDLSKQIQEISYAPGKEGGIDGFYVTAQAPDGTRPIDAEWYRPEQLEAVVGKEVAQKIVALEGERRGDQPGAQDYVLRGDNLKVGGEGLKRLYDSDFRNVVNSLPVVKKAGVKVGSGEVDLGRDVSARPSYEGPEVTPHQIRAEIPRQNAWMSNQSHEILRAMEQQGSTFKQAVEGHGSIAFAEAMGGRMVGAPTRSEQIHLLPIPQNLREALASPQPRFAQAQPDPQITTAVEADHSDQLMIAASRLAQAGAKVDVYSKTFLQVSIANELKTRIDSLAEQYAAADEADQPALQQRIEKLQSQLDAVDRIKGVTYSPFHLAVGLDNVSHASASDLVVLLHEGAHATLAQDPVMAARVIKATNAAFAELAAKLESNQKKTGFTEQINGDPEELLVSAISQQLAAEGIPESSSLATALWQWVKDLYYRTAMAVQAAFGREPNGQLALDWFENQMRRITGGDFDWRFAHIFDRVAPPPMSVKVWTQQTTGNTPGGLTDFFDSLSQSVKQPSVLPDSIDAAAWNLQYATNARPDQTQTPAFKKWFGDSEVVDENGAPKVFYHGTPVWDGGGRLGDVTSFNRNAAREALGRAPGMDQVGSWFVASPDASKSYSGSQGATYPVYLGIRNPAELTWKRFLELGQQLSGWKEKTKEGLRNPAGRWDPEPLRQKLKSEGYDGIHFDASEKIDGNEQEIYVAFEPTQIKSAIGNRGTFDPADPDIRFATEANPGSELDIPERESNARIQAAAINYYSKAFDNLFAEAQKTRPELKFEQWWAEVHGGQTPKETLGHNAEKFPGSETAEIGGEKMTTAMNGLAAVEAKRLLKAGLAKVAERDARSIETSAAAEKQLVATAKKVNEVESRMRDATMHEATLTDNLKEDIREALKAVRRGLDTARYSGALMQAVRDAEGLAENDGIPTEYQRLFKRVLANEVPLFDYIQAIAKLDLPLSDLSTPEIRKAITDNAESDPVLATLSEPRNKPLLVALSALVRRNYEQVDLLLLRRADQAKFLAIHGDLKAIREASVEQLEEMQSKLNAQTRAVTFADRLKRSFIEKRAKLRKYQKTIQTTEERRPSLTAARAGLEQQIETLETEHLAHPSEWTPNEGATYVAMHQDSEGRWLPTEKTLHFTPEGPAVNAAELLADQVSNRAYLAANPHKAGSKTYQLVSRQVQQVDYLDVQQTYPESRRIWYEKWFIDPGSLLLSGGGPAAARAVQMLKRWQFIETSNREVAEVDSPVWANRFAEMTRLSGLDDPRQFLALAYEPAWATIEANPGLEEGPALREAVRAARRRLTASKIAPNFDEKFKDFLRLSNDRSKAFEKIAYENGAFVQDEKLDGELRRAIPRGWGTLIRRMDAATVSTILTTMDAHGWRMKFERTDPETKVKTETTEGFEAGAVRKPGATIVKSTTFEALMGDGPDAQKVMEDPAALTHALSGFFPPQVVNRWLEPFINKPGQPLFTDLNGDAIDQMTLQQKWQDAGGDLVKWIDSLAVEPKAEFPLTDEGADALETDPADWRRSMLGQIEGLYVMEARAAAESNQVRNLFDGSGRPAHMLMDARQNDLLPPEHVQHMVFDQVSSRNLLATIAFHAAFGRNGEAMNRAIGEIEGGLRARKNAYQRVTERNAGRAAREEAAKAEGYTFKELIHASKIYNQVQQGKETLVASFGFGNMAGVLADVRGGLEVLHFIANQTTNNPKTGLLNMLQPTQRAINRRSIGPVAIRDTGRAFADIGKQFFGGALENLGLHLLRSSEHAKWIGAAQGQGVGQLPWTEVFGEGTRMGKRGEDMTLPVKMMRSLQALQKKGPRVGFGQSKEFLRQGNIPFFSNIMAYMGNVAANANATAEATSLERMVKAAMEHFVSHPEDLKDPTFRLTAKDLGAHDKAWFFDPGSFDYYRRALVEYGLGNLEQMAREGLDRQTKGQPILSKEQVIKTFVMTGNELDLQGSLNTNPGIWATNPILKFATPLIGWPIRQMAQVHTSMRDADGRASVLSVLKSLGILASWSLPIGLAFTFMTDEYDDKILKKKTNLGNLDPISGLPILGPALALTNSKLDPMDQIRSMGVRLSRAGNIYGLGADFVSTVLSGMDPTSGQRQFSLDSRILAFSQLANFGQAIGNWINSGFATTYANIERPLLQTIGGAGALHAIDMANGLFNIDNQEARITARTNAGQWLRSAGREVGMEIRKSAGSSTSITPMGAWVREMVLAALGDDRLQYLEAYRRAVNAAREEGKPDPEAAVLEGFRARSPIEVFRNKPSDAELAQVLAAMNENGRTAVTEALQRFDQYGELIAPSDFEKRITRMQASQRATVTRAQGGSSLRQRLAEGALR